MKEYFKKIIFILIITILSSYLFCGCWGISGNGGNLNLPGQGEIIIAGGEEVTDDTTPLLAILSAGADYMSFSGDGEQWTDWIPYAESYEDFNIASGEYGTETGPGIKYIFIRFKDLQGNISSEDDFSFDEIEYILPPPPTKGSILINEGAELTSGSTPLLTITSEGADYMSFSGDGEEWTEWISYSESYDGFDIASGEYGTEFSQGKKYVYVRFKNEQGELSPEGELASDNITFQLSDLNLKYIRVFPDEVTMKIRETQVFIVKGINQELDEVPLDGNRVIWSICCNASVFPEAGSVSVVYTAPSGVGENRFIKATYDNYYHNSAWIKVVE